MALIGEAFPSNYIKASDLRGKQVTVKIDKTDFEMLGQERKLVVYFKGKERGLVLNKTNANTIAAAYGDDTDDWTDAELILFEAMVDYQGRSVPAVRIKVPPRRPASDRPRATPNGDDYSSRRASEQVTSGPQTSRFADREPPARDIADEIDDQIPF